MSPKLHISNAPAMVVFSDFPPEYARGKTASFGENGLNIAVSATVLGLLIALLPGSTLAQSGDNMWNPFPSPQVQNAPNQPPATMPKYYGDAPAPAPFQAPAQQVQPGPATPSRFAPPGLNQLLSSGPYTQSVFPRLAPPSGPVIGYQNPALQGNAPSSNGPGGPAYYPQGYNNGFNGFGSNNPYNSYGYPGGYGGYAPLPGNNSGGGFPGFNFSPFGFF